MNNEAITRAKDALEKFERMLGHNARILIVEDEPDVLICITALLRRVGCNEIFKALDGDEALWNLKNYRFDMALVNLKLPKITGVEIIKWCRDHFPSLPTPIVTGFDIDSPMVQEVMKFNPTPTVVQKPFTIEAFTTLLAQHRIATPYGPT